MDHALRKGAFLLVLVFIGFYLFTDPNGLATLARDGSSKGWDALVQLFQAIIKFLNALFS